MLSIMSRSGRCMCLCLLLASMISIDAFAAFSSFTRPSRTVDGRIGRSTSRTPHATPLMMSDKDVRLFIFGVGYTGLGVVRVAQDMWGERVKVSGTCRSAGKAAKLVEAGVNAHLFNVDDEYAPLQGDALDDLLSATHVLTTIAPVADFSKDPVLEFHQKDLVSSSNLKWAGYASTTGVYGDYKGDWVSEESECRIGPKDRAWFRLEAERAWCAALPDVANIFRIGGIYGPGRCSLDTIKEMEGKTEPIDPTDTHYINRMHVGDISRCMVASMAKGGAGIWNLVDDAPCDRETGLRFARTLLGYPTEGTGLLPGKTDTSSAKALRLQTVDNKRVNNSKTKAQLCDLKFPDFRAGLTEINNGNTYPFKK